MWWGCGAVKRTRSLTPTDAAPPRGVIALDFLLTLALVLGARFLVRAVIEGLATAIARFVPFSQISAASPPGWGNLGRCVDPCEGIDSA